MENKVKQIGIYKITNVKNNKVYIGSSKQIQERWKQHLYRLNSNNHHSEKLQLDFNEHGIDNFKFEVITECEYEKLLELEDMYIKEYNSFFEGYNMTQSVFQFWKTYKKYQKDIKAEKYKNEITELEILCDELNIKTNFRIAPTKVKRVIQLVKHYSENYDTNKFNAKIESWEPMPELRLEYENYFYDELMFDKKKNIVKDSDRKDNRYCISYRCKILQIKYEDRYEI